MADPLRYYMDQHFPNSVTQALRQRGIDVLTAQEADRCTLPDVEQLVFAAKEGRVTVTFDSDYLALHQSGISHADIAWCPQRKYGIGLLIEILALLHTVAERDQMASHVEYL